MIYNDIQTNHSSMQEVTCQISAKLPNNAYADYSELLVSGSKFKINHQNKTDGLFLLSDTHDNCIVTVAAIGCASKLNQKGHPKRMSLDEM